MANTLDSHQRPGANGSNFELPALDLNFGSITDGTDIPPPPASPTLTPPSSRNILSKDETKLTKNDVLSKSNRTVVGSKRPAEVPLSSQTVSGRQGSIRRLLSRTRLNKDFDDGYLENSNSEPSLVDARPSSRGGLSFIGERTSNRASGWFRRLRSGEQAEKRRQNSLVGASTNPAPLTRSPGVPPPMIPEFTELEKTKGSLGGDIFGSIK